MREEESPVGSVVVGEGDEITGCDGIDISAIVQLESLKADNVVLGEY